MNYIWYAMIAYLWALGTMSICLGAISLACGVIVMVRQNGDQIVAIYAPMIGLALILAPLLHFFQ